MAMSQDDVISEVDDLLSALFNGGQIRRFMQRFAGGDVARELPGPSSSDATMADEAAQLLRRHGLVGQSLFQSLADERPGRLARINEAATACGCEPARDPDRGGVPARSTVPESVVTDVYEKLKVEQDLLQSFLSGPMHALTEAQKRAVGSTPDEFKLAAAEVRAWAGRNEVRFTLPEVRAALVHLKDSATFNPLENGFTFLVAIANESGRRTAGVHMQTLGGFATRPLADLYRLARKIAQAD
jgi:hypothetical protein